MNDDRRVDATTDHAGDGDPAPLAARVVAGAFGVAFGGIGLSLIGFLWGQPFGRFGSPPLFFRVFGSLLAIPFVAIGGAAVYGAITGKSLGSKKPGSYASSANPGDRPTGNRSPAGYACPSCGAPLASNADVSPLGDVKCGHCDRWFNVHEAG